MFFLEMQVRARHQELLKEAETNRLISQIKGETARQKQPHFQMLFWLGRNLHRYGHLLLERFGDIEQDAPPQAVKRNL